MLKTLVWSAQNWSISSEICLENNHKIGRVFPDCFLVKFALKLPAKFPRNNFAEIIVPKTPAKFDFFLRNLSEALHSVHVFISSSLDSYVYF